MKNGMNNNEMKKNENETTSKSKWEMNGSAAIVNTLQIAANY